MIHDAITRYHDAIAANDDAALDAAITFIERHTMATARREQLPPIPLVLEWFAAHERGDDADLLP